MIDFHSHILPEMDDGAESVDESLELLRMLASQGVTAVCATPHYLADEESPEEFILRRRASAVKLGKALHEYPDEYPRILLGAEIAYYPGMSETESLRMLSLGKSLCILIEPPMDNWQDYMLDEIEETGHRLQRYPVLAHVDRYMRMLDYDRLPERLYARRFFMQYNASFFCRGDTARRSVELLQQGRVHFVGSDCHSVDERPPRLGEARAAVVKNGGEQAWKIMESRSEKMLQQVAK